MKYSNLFRPVFADTLYIGLKVRIKKSRKTKLPGFFFLSLCVNLYLCLFIVIDRLLITYVLTK